jgi:uncharacterized phage infection (PIP) family protein YhgE
VIRKGEPIRKHYKTKKPSSDENTTEQDYASQHPAELRSENKTKQKKHSSKLGAFLISFYLFVGRAGFEPAKM